MKAFDLVHDRLMGKKPLHRAKGEFGITTRLAKGLTGHVQEFEARIDATLKLGWHYVAEPCDNPTKNKYFKPEFYSLKEAVDYLGKAGFSFTNLYQWKKKTDLFVFALIDGPFQTLVRLMDFNKFLIKIASDPDVVKNTVGLIKERIMEAIVSAIDHGADGIIIGEDVAYNKGLIISPRTFEQIFLPSIAEIAATCNKPVVFHSDGNINSILDMLAHTAISGIHSLEEAAGMNLQTVRKAVGNKLCLLGGLDLGDILQLSDERFEERINRWLEAGDAIEPYIFGTSAGILDDVFSYERLLMLYRAI